MSAPAAISWLSDYNGTRRQGRIHGLISCYQNGKCRCAQCREIARLKRAEYRARQRRNA